MAELDQLNQSLLDNMLSATKSDPTGEVSDPLAEPIPAFEPDPIADPATKIIVKDGDKVEEPDEPAPVEPKETAKEEEPTDPALEPSDPAEPEDQQVIIEDLRKQLNEMASKIGVPVAQIMAQEEEPAVPVVPVAEPTPVAPKSQPIELDPIDFLTPDEVDNVIDNPKLVNVAVNRAMNRMLTHVADVFGPVIDDLSTKIESMPQQMSDTAQAQVNMGNLVGQFYQANEDLRPVADFVNYTIAQEAQTALVNKEKITLEQIFERGRDKARTTLRMPAPVGKKADENKPALPGARTSRPARPGTQQGPKTQQDYMAELT